MEFSLRRNAKIAAFLLIALVVTQATFTVLFNTSIAWPRPLIWGLEAVLFTILAAFAGAALVQAGKYQLGWSAIAFSAVLNVVQVSIGLKLFKPFGGVAQQVETMGPLIGGIIAFSFLIYNAGKILIGLAALVFGMSKMNAGSKALGGLTALVGVIAIIANIVLIIFGRDAFLPSPAGGATGVAATLLLALCLLSMDHEEKV